YSRAPSKHDQLVKPIMGDLVEVASQLMADKANKIRTPEDLVDAMSQHVGAVLAGGIAKEAKTIFAEASKNPEARDKSLTSVKKAMESGLAPAKKLSISNDEAASRLQLAVDRAREDGHIIDVKKDSQTLREGAQLYANIGRDGVINIVMERAKQFGGKLSDGEIVAAKIAMDDGVAHKEAASDPAVYLRQLAFANAFRITATEAGRGLRMYRWDINDPTDVRVKREIHDIFTAALEKNPEKLTLDDATKQLKKIRTFLEKNVGVPDVESIPTAVLTDQAKMVDLVREWSAANATMGMKARTWCMNSLVSAFKTHAANVGGSAGNLAVEYTLHRQLEARLNQLFKVDGVLPSDLAGLTSQMMKVQSMALRDAANYAKTGKNELEQKVYGSDWVGQLRKQKRSFSAKSKLTQEPIEWAGDKLQYVGRALGTEDAYFVSVSGHVEALAASRMHARRVMRDRTGSEGVGTKEYNDIVDREFSDYTSDSWRRGMNRSEYLAFKNETAEGLKTLLSIRRKHPWLTPLAWFLTTPWNLISRGAEFAPGIGLINRGVFRGGNDFSPGDPMYRESKAEIRTRAAAAQIIGLVATAAIAATKASMFNDDGDEPFITGSDPPMSFEKGEKEARRRSLQPYTVKNFLNIFDPNERISYRRLDPMATGLGLTVDIVDMFQDYAHTGSLDRLASKAKSATVGQFVDKPFLQGPSDVIRMFQDGPSKKSPIEYALGLLGNFYPRFFQQFPAALDDKVRETKNYGATKQQEGQPEAARMLKTAAYRATGFPSLPFVGQLAEPKVNLGGEEVGKTGSPLYRLTVPADRYGDEGISPEARRLDLNYIQSVPHLAEDAPNYPTESGPSLSFGGKNFKMFPQDWAEAEKQRGAMFMDLAKKAGFTEKRSKPFSPEELKALGAFAQAGSGVAKAKMIPRYWSPNK
ncbi:MAG: hypothetical protein KBC95_05090, partial [Candidatus Peribacteraceae bacterium]|nr:hypothetical protein [Candidatus Peribacteraceae bacterium]